MNEAPSNLEREFRRLQPTEPSGQLVARLAQALDRPAIGSQRIAFAWWQRLGFNRPAAALGWGLLSPAAAACLAVIVTAHPHAKSALPSPPASSVTPVGKMAATSGTQAVNIVYQTLDDGVVSNGGQEPVRRVRYRSADRVSWHNPQSGAQWEVSYPREDVLLIPVQAE